MAPGSARRLALIGSIVVTGLIALVGGVMWANQRDRISPPPSAPVSLEQSQGAPTYPAFAVLGDNYAAGYGPGWRSGWVRLLGDRMCWTHMPVNRPDAAGPQGGTGFTTAGTDPGMARYLDRVPAVTAGSPQIVLVEGGLNDRGAPTSQEITAAAASTFTAVKERLGAGTVIAIGPLLTPSTEPAETERVADAIGAAAAAVGIPYINPVAERWLADPRLFEAGGVHLTRDGYREYTQRLKDSLNFIGLASACKT